MPDLPNPTHPTDLPSPQDAAAAASIATPVPAAAADGTAAAAGQAAEASADAAPETCDAAGDAAGDTTGDAADGASAAGLPAAPAKPAEISPAACAELLKQHFPALFSGPAKPLKLRIQLDIQQRAPGIFSKSALSAFFRRYTGSTGYLIALGKATSRFDLDGQPAGELSEEHRQLARDELARRRQLTREREQQAQAQQQAQQAELQQARQARLALLRDFERTTLTPANFCALKGLSAEALDEQLALARREAAEAPPPRPLDDRRGPPGARRDGRPPQRPGPRDGPREGQREGPRNGPREGPGAPRGAGRPPGRPNSR